MDDDIRRLRARLVSLDAERRAAEAELERLEASRSSRNSLRRASTEKPSGDAASAERSVAEKLALFRSLFLG